MKGKKNPKRNQSSMYSNKVKKHSAKHDSFFKEDNSKKRRKFDTEGKRDNGFDAEIESDASDSGDDFFADENGGENKEEDEEEEEDELERETVEERRRRLAWELVHKVRKGEKEERDEEEDDDDSDREEKEGNRDSLVAKIMLQEQLEESGRVRRFIASKLQKPDDDEEPQLLSKHRQSVTAVALSDDDRLVFSASKDGGIAHWDLEVGKADKYLWPSEKVLKAHHMVDPKGRASNLKKGRAPKHSKQILALAVSSDGRHLATAGLDRHVHLWDTRTRQHIEALHSPRGPISCLAFRQGTVELFGGSFDRTVTSWNADDKKYTATFFGHQSEVLSIDCLRKERILTVGRDRTLQLYKVPEESRLIYRASASSLECCCFVGNDEFLSGSDDGSIELWTALRKKPVSIVKNAHALPSLKMQVDLNDNGRMSNGHIEGTELKASNPCSTAQSWVSSVSVCRNSDLAASGAGNGCIRLWEINSDNRGIRPLFDVPLVGYVNSLAIAKSGRFLVAGVGQEPRLGRWDRISTARNGVVMQSFKHTS